MCSSDLSVLSTISQPHPPRKRYFRPPGEKSRPARLRQHIEAYFFILILFFSPFHPRIYVLHKRKPLQLCIFNEIFRNIPRCWVKSYLTSLFSHLGIFQKIQSIYTGAEAVLLFLQSCVRSEVRQKQRGVEL